MAGAKLEIEIVEGGGRGAVGQPPPPSYGSHTPPAPPPAAFTQQLAQQLVPPGAVRTAREHEAAVTSTSEGLRTLGRVLGYGGLITAAELLTRSFRELSRAHKENVAAEAPDRTGASSERGGGRRRRRGQDVPEETAPPPRIEPPGGHRNYAGDKYQGPGGMSPQQVYDFIQKHGRAPTDADFPPGGGRGGFAVPPGTPQGAPMGAGPLPPPRVPAGAVQSVAAPGAGTVAPAVAAESAEAVEALGTAAAGASVAFGPLGLAAAGATLKLTLMVAAVKKVSDALDEQARNLAKYSGVISGAVAAANVRRQLNEMERADRLGPLLASFENTRAKMSQALYRLGTEILKALLEIFEFFKPGITLLSKFIEIEGHVVGVLVDGFAIVKDLMTLNAAGIRVAFGDILDHMNKVIDAIRGEDTDITNDKWTQQFFDLFGVPGRNGPQLAPAGAGAANPGPAGFGGVGGAGLPGFGGATGMGF